MSMEGMPAIFAVLTAAIPLRIPTGAVSTVSTVSNVGTLSTAVSALV